MNLIQRVCLTLSMAEEPPFLVNEDGRMPAKRAAFTNSRSAVGLESREP